MDFINTVYVDLENRIKDYMKNKNEDLELILRDIREASLYGKIASYEEIHLMDLLELEEAEDIDDHYVTVVNENTGGLQVDFKEDEKHDMSFLDDFDDDNEEKEEGFLGFLNNNNEE